MQNIIMTLAFSMVLLIFMIYPAIRIVDFLQTKFEISEKAYNLSTVILTIVLSLICGVLINYL